MSTRLADRHQFAIDIHAVRITGVSEALAHTVRAVAPENPDHLRVVAKDVPILAVTDRGKQLYSVGTCSVVAGRGSIVEWLDGGHGDRDVILQRGLGFVEQALSRVADLSLGLPVQHEYGRGADHQRKYQNRQDCQRQNLGFQTETHRIGLMVIFISQRCPIRLSAPSDGH